EEEVLRDFFDPDIEVFAEPAVLNSGTYRGWDGWKQWTTDWEEAWEEIRYEPLSFHEVGEDVAVVPVRVTGIGRGSGVEVVQDNCFLFEVRDGLCVRLHLYHSEQGALDAARTMAGE